MTDEHELFVIARKLRYDLTAMQAKVSALLEALSRADLPRGGTVCDHCKMRLKGPLSLAEHLYLSHDGPLPEHWAQAEARAAGTGGDAAETSGVATAETVN